MNHKRNSRRDDHEKVDLLRHPYGFGWGWTEITRINGPGHDTGIGFSILKLKAGKSEDLTEAGLETACLLLAGQVVFRCDTAVRTVERRSLFNENPFAVHCPYGISLHIEAKTDCELAVCRLENSKLFPPLFYDSDNMMESENRGQGLLDGTVHRIVRTIFDYRNCPDGNLVLGEVINFPGRWSSYPPHHHEQPEIYHYRFTKPQGYGHAELGETVYKIRPNDTLIIRGNLDHPQVAAPGYGMYYIWVIRHLPKKPYKVPVFTEEHHWANDPNANYWKPKGQHLPTAQRDAQSRPAALDSSSKPRHKVSTQPSIFPWSRSNLYFDEIP